MRYIGRVLGHSVLILVIVLLATAAVTLATGSADGWVTTLVNGPLAGMVAERAGLHFHAGMLHVAWQRGCPLLIELNGADVTLQDAARDHAAVRTMRLCGDEAILHSIVAGSPQHERLLTARKVRANLYTRSIFAEKIAVADRAGGILFQADKGELTEAGHKLVALGLAVLQDPNSGEPMLRAGQVQTSSLHLPSQVNGTLNLARLDATSLQLRWNQAGQTGAGLVALRDSGQEFVAFARQALASGRRLLVVIHRLTYLALLAATVFVTMLKWLASAEVRPRKLRALISFVPALVAYGLFVLFRPVSTAAGLLFSSAALGTIAAIALWRILYRRNHDWLTRWEPFVVDALAPVTIMLLLLLCAFNLQLPAGNMPGSIFLSSVDLKTLSAHLESSGLTSEIDALAANLTSLKFVLQSGRLGLATATLDRFELNGGNARVEDNAGQELARSQIQNLAVADFHLGPETSTGAGRPFDVKDVQMRASVETGILARHVREFHWLPAEWHGPQRFQLAVSGNLSREEHLQFGASAEVRSRVLDLDTTAAGDSHSMQIRSLHTLKDSPMKIGAATGTITWVDGLRTVLALREIAGPGFRVESANVDARLHVPEFTLHSRMQRANVSLSGYHTSLDSTAFDLAFSEHKFFTSAHISRAAVQSPKQAAQDPWLEADFPIVEANASGSRAGWKSLAGTVSFRIADGEQSIFAIDRALRFHGDFAEGTVTVPEQNLELRQSMTTVIPRQLAFSLSLAGDLQSINVDARVPKMILPEVAPFQAEIDKLQLSSQWRRDNAFRLSFSSGWNRLVVPTIAGDWTFKEIEKLRLETGGTATPAFFEQLTALRKRAGRVPFDPEHWFRIEGRSGAAASSVFIQGRHGGGAELSPVVDIRLLRIRRGRIAESNIHAEASGIRTLDGRGNLSAAADWNDIGNSCTIAVRVPARGGANLLETTFLRLPGLLRFRLSHELSLARFIPQVQPFLSQAGIDLSDFEIGATLLQLEGQADFAGSEWTRLVTRAETAPGPLFRFTPSSSPATALEVALGSSGRGLRVDLAAGEGTARVTAEAPGLSVRLDGGAEHANIDASFTATLSHSASASPLLSKIHGTLADVRAGIESARRVFPINSEEKAPITWKLKLSDDGAGEPVLAVGSDRLKLRLRADPSSISLGPSTRLDFSSNLAADLSLHEDQLILDALMRLDYGLRMDGLGSHRADLRVPLLVAFGEALQPVIAPHGPLWDSQHYSVFWDGFRPVNALLAGKEAWQWTEVALGPVEIGELSVAPPLRAAIELSKDVIQVDLPVKGSFLYGDSAGTLQSQLRWTGDEAALDTFLGWSLQNAQAEALHIATRFGYQPLVQDLMGLSLSASARGVTLSPRVLEAAVADPGRFNQFDRIALDLDVASAPGSVGRLQAESDFDVKRMNDLMRQITNAIQLTYPPEAITWENARVKLLLKDGALDNEVPLVALTGLQGARNNLAQFSGTVRLFAGRDRSTPFQDIVHTLMRFYERLP